MGSFGRGARGGGGGSGWAGAEAGTGAWVCRQEKAPGVQRGLELSAAAGVGEKRDRGGRSRVEVCELCDVSSRRAKSSRSDETRTFASFELNKSALCGPGAREGEYGAARAIHRDVLETDKGRELVTKTAGGDLPGEVGEADLASCVDAGRRVGAWRRVARAA